MMKAEGCLATAVQGGQEDTVTICYSYYEDDSHTGAGICSVLLQIYKSWWAKALAPGLLKPFLWPPLML